MQSEQDKTIRPNSPEIFNGPDPCSLYYHPYCRPVVNQLPVCELNGPPIFFGYITVSVQFSSLMIEEEAKYFLSIIPQTSTPIMKSTRNRINTSHWGPVGRAAAL